jgi:hypothetical protein
LECFGKAVRALRKTGVPTITTAVIFAELERERPKTAPVPQLKHLGGSSPIALRFKVPQGSSSSLSVRQSMRPYNKKEKHVLVHLVLDRDCQVATNEFRKVIETLPTNFQVTMVEAFETSASTLVIIRMDYFSWATLSAAIDFGVIGEVMGPSC